jgi:hypothetical protein
MAYYVRIYDFTPGLIVRSAEVDAELNAIVGAFNTIPAATLLTQGNVDFATETGSANAYDVAYSPVRTSYVDGSQVAFVATHTNTGTVTVQVDALTTKPVVNMLGTALVAGEIISGLIYEFRFDSAGDRFIMVNWIDTVSALAAIAAAAAAAADAVSTAADVVTTNADVVTTGADAVLTAADVTYTEEWAINPEDDPVSVAAGGDNSTTFSALHWAAKAAEGGGGVNPAVNLQLNNNKYFTGTTGFGSIEVNLAGVNGSDRIILGEAGYFTDLLGTVKIPTNLSLPSPTVPASAGAAGLPGQISWASGFIYICVSSNTWQRVVIATW